MTAEKAIYEAGAMVPHSIETGLLLTWLDRLERYASVEVEGLECDTIKDLKEEELGSKLRIPDPYSWVYPLYLQCMIHLAMGEYDRYSAVNQTFNNAFDDYSKWYMRRG